MARNVLVSVGGFTVELVKLSDDALPSVSSKGLRSQGAPSKEYLLIKNRLGILVGKVTSPDDVLALIGADEYRTLA